MLKVGIFKDFAANEKEYAIKSGQGNENRISGFSCFNTVKALE